MKFEHAITAALILLAGCSTPGTGTALTTSQDSIPVEAGMNDLATREPAAMAESPAATELSEGELSIWQSPRFKQRFIESYLSETEIEPRISSVESDVMLEVLEFISKDEMDQAIELLKENQGEGSNLAVFDFTLANIHFQREEYAVAAKLYELAVGKFEKYRRACAIWA